MLDSQDLYDELSRMLQLYRRKAAYCEKLLFRFAHEFFDERDTAEIRQYLSTLFLEEIGIVDRYIQQQFSSKGLRMILYRFFSRIVQMVRNQRARLQAKVYITLTAYFESVEGMIYSMVSSVHGDLLEGLLGFYDRSQDYAVELIGLLEEKNRRNHEKPVEAPRIIIEQPRAQVIQPNPQVELPSPAKTVKTMSEDSPRKPSKLMEAMKIFDCLDLDISNFRSVYLYCKHHNQLIEEETLDRNQLIGQDIKAYKKAYAQYQVRRARRAQYLRSKRESGAKDEPSTPLQAIGQATIQAKHSRHSRLIDKEFSSVRRMDPNSGYLFKQNNSAGFIDAARTIGGFFKSPKPNLSPKKVLLCYNKLSLRPVEEFSKTGTPSSSKKKSRTRSSTRRLGDSFDMLIEGQRIRDNSKDMQPRRGNLKMFSQKLFTSNLFTAIN